MSQNNSGYQDLIINNGVISTVSNLVNSDNSRLQGIQMNQFAICANPGSTPVLVPYITPMILSPQSKVSIDGSNTDNRSQHGPVQLTNNITIPSNMINSGNLPLGLSYINLSQLTSQTGGGGIPIQFSLNTGTNQHFTLPLSSFSQLTNELQIPNTYTLAPQIKFEPDVQTNVQIDHISDNNNFQKSIVKHETEIPSNEMPTNKRGRKKPIVRKAGQYLKRQKVELENREPKPIADNVGDSEVLYDHKGRPFMYSCNECPKKFTQNSRLIAHLRCHSGIRPYTCNQCGFSFTQKSYLIRHAAVHKEDRPFTCSKCQKTYKHYGSLANHRKLHCRELLNGSSLNRASTVTDDLDETIQQTIESVQMQHQSLHHQQPPPPPPLAASSLPAPSQNNYIITYTANQSTADMHHQTAPIVYFNNNNNSSSNNICHPISDLQLPGSGPIVFPSQELPSMSAVSLLPTNRTAINELKAITTHHLANSSSQVDVDELTASSVNKILSSSSSIDFQHHMKQEPTYFNVTIRSGHADGPGN